MCAAADTAPRVLFITLSNIGDLVLSTPALRALHAAYPDHRVDIVADARSSALLRACPFLGDLCHRDKRAGWRGTWALVRALRGRRYAAIVDLRTGFAPWLLRGARRTAGWRRGVHGPHAVEQHFAVVARVLPAPVTAAGIPSTQVWITDADTREAAALLAPLPRGRWLALAPGANWPGKVWPRAHYAALVARLTDAFS
ncbi:MAG: glycosyltransferase family 9 protein, partial [Gammaproteobacteria bacterium]